MKKSNQVVLVWDILVRIFHWSLVFFCVIAFVTEDDFLSIHSYAGYTIFLLITFRFIWGVIGTKYARFSNFSVMPEKAIKYLKAELSGDAEHYMGHNPAGAVMVITLLLIISLTALTGMATIATEGYGPFATTFISLWSGELLGEVHEFFANSLLGLIILHILGVIFSSLLQEENLIKAMINGRKIKK